MIQLDRSSDVPIHVQLVTRLRYLIASGHFQKEERLPSTRRLADQLGVSFHTVRKAYHALETSGHLTSKRGSGFRVARFEPTPKSHRMERGAEIVHESLQQLIGLGLDEQEIEYLIQEQSSILESGEASYKIVVAGPFREWGIACAMQVSSLLRRECIPTTTSELRLHADADFALVPFRFVRSIMGELTNADIIGLQTELDGESLGQISRLLERETLGLVTQYADAIGPLTTELREQTGFGGQILAVSVEYGDAHVATLARQSELVLYTEAAWKTSRSAPAADARRAVLTRRLTSESIDRLVKLIPH